MNPIELPMNRRHVVVGGAAAAAALAAPAIVRAQKGGPSTLRIGVIGCGGRGTGAAANALEATADARVVALADLFPDRLEGSRKELAGLEGGLGERAQVAADRCYSGFDSYQKLLAGDVDLVILATPPHFRPIHLAAAIEAGKHVFMEKPAGTDPRGVRSVLASGELAAQKKLAIVAGTQRRHERSYLAAMAQVQNRAIGRIVSAECWWNQGGLWMFDRQPQWSDMEWQLRNWLYFTWLSGDHICEQHVHNLDVVNWAIGAHPLRATGMGGRQVRTSPAYGHVFDHFAIEYEYPDGVTLTSWCRQIDGCANRVEELLVGTDGTLSTAPGAAQIRGARPWKFEGPDDNPYVQEHVDLVASIRSGKPLNEARAVAESTLTAIMGRMSAYTGKTVTWEQALESKLDLAPPAYVLGPLATPEVPVPGKTPLI